MSDNNNHNNDHKSHRYSRKIFLHDVRPWEKPESILLAAALSSLVYETHPLSQLTHSAYESITKCITHTFISNDRFCGQRVLFAKTANSLYVVFRGTQDFNDVLADLDVSGKFAGKGLCHRGFHNRASMIPLWEIVNHMIKHPHLQLIFCGHSLGGAVAQLAMMKLLSLKELPPLMVKDLKENDRVHCITFGAPFFADKEYREYVMNNKWTKNFLTFVNEDDVVPYILFIADVWSSVKTLKNSFKDKAEDIAELTEWLLGFVPYGSVVSKSFKLLHKLFVKSTKYLPKYIFPQYSPIGNYCFINKMAFEGESDSLSVTNNLSKKFESFMNLSESLFDTSMKKSIEDHRMSVYYSSVLNKYASYIDLPEAQSKGHILFHPFVSQIHCQESSDVDAILVIQGNDLALLCETGPYLCIASTGQNILYKKPQVLLKKDSTCVSISLGVNGNSAGRVFKVALRTVGGLTRFVTVGSNDVYEGCVIHDMDPYLLYHESFFGMSGFHMIKFAIRGGYFSFDFHEDDKIQVAVKHTTHRKKGAEGKAGMSIDLSKVIHLGMYHDTTHKKKHQPGTFCIITEEDGHQFEFVFQVTDGRDSTADKYVNFLVQKMEQHLCYEELHQMTPERMSRRGTQVQIPNPNPNVVANQIQPGSASQPPVPSQAPNQPSVSIQAPAPSVPSHAPPPNQPLPSSQVPVPDQPSSSQPEGPNQNDDTSPSG